ncbi:hypothetical protein [Streptomyces malaysiensis]
MKDETKTPPRELIGFALYSWDETTDRPRSSIDYLDAAGRIISYSTAGLDDAWMIVEVISLWDASAGERRTFEGYREVADRILARL